MQLRSLRSGFRSFVWLCLTLQLAGTTALAGGLVLCIESDGRVAVETAAGGDLCCRQQARDDDRDGTLTLRELDGEDCLDFTLIQHATWRDGSGSRFERSLTAVVSTTPARVHRVITWAVADVMSAIPGVILHLITVVLLV